MTKTDFLAQLGMSEADFLSRSNASMITETHVVFPCNNPDCPEKEHTLSFEEVIEMTQVPSGISVIANFLSDILGGKVEFLGTVIIGKKKKIPKHWN
ncbi:MAG: hypothetical protein RL023_327 [Candidatus Parcubacteria bacterium]|jgi:hypothetical protein